MSRLWIESAHQSLTKAGAKVCGDTVRTFQDAEQFFAVLVSGPEGDGEGKAKTMPIADKAAFLLKQGTPLERVVEVLLAALPEGEYIPFSILQVKTSEVSKDTDLRARLVECDAPPLFLTHVGRLILLPVVEEVLQGHLFRECDFTFQDGDHIAMVSEGYIRAERQRQRWHWQDVAVAIRRWTETRCDAEQLLNALINSYYRRAWGEPGQDVTIIAMHVRPLRSATVWSGPPVDPTLDRAALEKLMAEPGMRIICGDTTAQIAARLSGAELELEPQPEDDWAEVPPTLCLERVNLVTEGLVTLGKARERIAGAKRLSDLPRKMDGATRLAQMLLTADRIHFIVGLAVNPEQAADTTGTIPLRRIVIDDLIRDLRVRGKVVSVEYF